MSEESTIAESTSVPEVSPYFVKSCGPLKSSVGSYVSIAGASKPIDTSHAFFKDLKGLTRTDDKFVAFPGQSLPDCFFKGVPLPLEVFNALTK